MLSDSLREALDLTILWEYRHVLLKGLAMSLGVFGTAAAVALTAGLLVALLRTGRWRPARALAAIYTEVSRNSPDYIMVVWVHFVLPLLIGTLIGRRLEFHPFYSSIVSLIAVPDLMYQVSMITTAEMKALPIYTGAALIYFVVVFAFANLLQMYSGDLHRLHLRVFGREQGNGGSAAKAVRAGPAGLSPLNPAPRPNPARRRPSSTGRGTHAVCLNER